MTDLEYWIECLSQSFDEHGVSATADQIRKIAANIEVSASMQSEVFGHHNIPNPLEEELRQTKKELQDERSKETCAECKGKGEIVSCGPYHGSISRCWKCNGEGRHL